MEEYGLPQGFSIHNYGKVNESEPLWYFESDTASTFMAENGYCAWSTSLREMDVEINVFNYDYNSYPLKVYLADKKRSPYYMLDTNTLRGEPIKIGDEKTRHYKISFEEVHWLEEAGDCINYGDGAQYMSYADCVAQEHAEIFKPILGCRPPWMSAPGHPDNCRGQTPLTSQQSEDWLNKLEDFIFDVKRRGKGDSGNCLKPCKGLFADSKMFIEKEAEENEEIFVSLTFVKEVKVTKYLRSYGLFELVVDVGSSLGLWIGLSIVGLFDLVLDAGTLIRKRFFDHEKNTKGKNNKKI